MHVWYFLCFRYICKFVLWFQFKIWPTSVLVITKFRLPRIGTTPTMSTFGISLLLHHPIKSGSVVDERQKSQIEKRKRNMTIISPISRGEREIWIPFLQFREEKEKSERIFSTFEKRKRNFDYISTISRREGEYWFFSFYFESRKRKVK